VSGCRLWLWEQVAIKKGSDPGTIGGCLQVDVLYCVIHQKQDWTRPLMQMCGVQGIRAMTRGIKEDSDQFRHSPQERALKRFARRFD